MTRATRERKEQFLLSFGVSTPRKAVERLFARHGLDMLSDEQLDEVVSDVIADWRLRERMNRRNRARAAASAA